MAAARAAAAAGGGGGGGGASAPSGSSAAGAAGAAAVPMPPKLRARYVDPLDAAAAAAAELTDEIVHRTAELLGDGQRGAAAELAATIKRHTLAVKGAALEAMEATLDETKQLQLQCQQRGILLARREANLGDIEARQRAAAAAKLARQMEAAQRLVCRRATELSRGQLLGQVWRALILHTAASKLVADRKRFRELAQQRREAPAGLAPPLTVVD